MPVVLLGLPTDDGFPDAAVSGTIIAFEGTCVIDGNDEGYAAPVDGPKVAGFDVAIGALVIDVGSLEKQSTHFNRTAQS